MAKTYPPQASNQSPDLRRGAASREDHHHHPFHKRPPSEKQARLDGERDALFVKHGIGAGYRYEGKK